MDFNQKLWRKIHDCFKYSFSNFAFRSCNLLNTLLAGLLESTIFFPTLNIGVILLTMLLCAMIYKEKIRRREATVLAFGVLSIMLLNFG